VSAQYTPAALEEQEPGRGGLGCPPRAIAARGRGLGFKVTPSVPSVYGKGACKVVGGSPPKPEQDETHGSRGRDHLRLPRCLPSGLTTHGQGCGAGARKMFLRARSGLVRGAAHPTEAFCPLV
jgi:hypothetical protein